MSRIANKVVIGDQFNSWTVTKEPETIKANRYCQCRCSCGTEKLVHVSSMVRGKTKDCGCTRKKSAYPPVKPGNRYGRLVVISCEEKKHSRDIDRWLCRCDCGKIAVKNGHSMQRGSTQSCGCLFMEHAVRHGSLLNNIHGMSGTAVYKRWKTMISRCKPYSIDSHNYFGRGIGVCKEWLDSPEAFMLWANENGFDENLEIDRVDNDEGYSPENCRFVTRIVNANNRRCSRTPVLTE